MPCYRCERVQTDPDPARPSAPWAVAVVGREQVLVCPDCQLDDPNWTEALATCPHCGSTRLRVMLGSIVCRACGRDS
jgi:Zn finger protein HypA/HybF involved in hydrogenase expression